MVCAQADESDPPAFTRNEIEEKLALEGITLPMLEDAPPEESKDESDDVTTAIASATGDAGAAREGDGEDDENETESVVEKKASRADIVKSMYNKLHEVSHAPVIAF